MKQVDKETDVTFSLYVCCTLYRKLVKVILIKINNNALGTEEEGYYCKGMNDTKLSEIWFACLSIVNKSGPYLYCIIHNKISSIQNLVSIRMKYHLSTKNLDPFSEDITYFKN
jgi:hypothetical protein